MRLFEIALKDKEFRSLTTDHFKAYEALADHFHVFHQQCIFHHFQNINKSVYPLFKDKSLSEVEKMQVALELTKYRNIFRTYNEQEANDLMDDFMENKNTLNKGLYRNLDKIMKHFQRHTIHKKQYNP
ncbi:hypothetical protein [Methanobrevibacter filiformis]|uniref:hypothetical protein n=1 Tax=Methanobrevibacter filiformis TaxID=55758 RepID=UPI000A9A75A7|nr:hypothetical protein [Methanobrevibacter filiformis]